MSTDSTANDTRWRRLAEAAGSLEVADLLKLAQETFGRKIAFASSMGLEDQALTDLLSKHAPGIAIFTIDTGRLPQETYSLIEQTRERYGLRLEVLFPQRQEVEEMVALHGPNLFHRSVESRKLCCRVRKVDVLRRRLIGLDAWLSGLRREQSVMRNQLQKVQWDAGNGLAKINPLADWTTQQIWDYIRANNVPYNALHDQGYSSIGCAPCTRAISPGEDIRAGRWWWESPEHKECGLHVVDGRLTRRSTH